MGDKDKKDNCPFEDEIRSAVELSQENNLQLEKLLSKDWYDNKELYEMIDGLDDKIGEFNRHFHKYNGLIEKVEKVKKTAKNNRQQVQEIIQKKETKSDVYSNWRIWLSWIITFILGLTNLYLVFA